MGEKWEAQVTVEHKEGKWSLYLISGRRVDATTGYGVILPKHAHLHTFIKSEPVENLKDIPYLTEEVRNQLLVRLARGELSRYMYLDVSEEDVKYYRDLGERLVAKEEVEYFSSLYNKKET